MIWMMIWSVGFFRKESLIEMIELVGKIEDDRIHSHMEGCTNDHYAPYLTQSSVKVEVILLLHIQIQIFCNILTNDVITVWVWILDRVNEGQARKWVKFFKTKMLIWWSMMRKINVDANHSLSYTWYYLLYDVSTRCKIVKCTILLL